ncbi:MAG: trehalose-phosphatase [bacterium]|nr:MAG: trehalose-phosphatase [bacterium]
MKILKPEIDLDGFFNEVARGRHRVLFIDYDGTLAPFRVERGKAVPYPGVRELLESILTPGLCRLVLVSGRSIEDLLPLIGLDHPPEIWGCHGWERRMPDGTYSAAELDETARSGLRSAQAIAQEQGFAEFLETKRACRALHWRGLDQEYVTMVRSRIETQWSKISKEYGLRLLEFDGGIELHVPGRNKGDAVKTVLDEEGDGAVAAYCGDDLTDEDAFRAMRGLGLSVLVNVQYHRTEADLWLEPPDELLLFLERWLDACRSET